MSIDIVPLWSASNVHPVIVQSNGISRNPNDVDDCIAEPPPSITDVIPIIWLCEWDVVAKSDTLLPLSFRWIPSVPSNITIFSFIEDVGPITA